MKRNSLSIPIHALCTMSSCERNAAQIVVGTNSLGARRRSQGDKLTGYGNYLP